MTFKGVPSQTIGPFIETEVVYSFNDSKSEIGSDLEAESESN